MNNVSTAIAPNLDRILAIEEPFRIAQIYVPLIEQSKRLTTEAADRLTAAFRILIHAGLKS
jgi:hypothetical protein